MLQNYGWQQFKEAFASQHETIDQNIKHHSAVGYNDRLPAKDDIKYRGNTQEDDNDKDSCNNEDEQMTEGWNFNGNIVDLRKRMILKDSKCSEKVKLGGDVYEIIRENQINQASLPQDINEVMDDVCSLSDSGGSVCLFFKDLDSLNKLLYFCASIFKHLGA